MAVRVLDASAFYAGIPFGSPEQHHTTQLILDEIQHIKKSHEALRTLIETRRLIVREPDSGFVSKIRVRARESGDMQELSEGDVSILALCLELQGQIITDDFAVSNVAASLGIKTLPVMTSGIRNAGRWIRYCTGCKAQFPEATRCPRCGNPLKKKLLRGQPHSIPLDK